MTISAEKTISADIQDTFAATVRSLAPPMVAADDFLADLAERRKPAVEFLAAEVDAFDEPAAATPGALFVPLRLFMAFAWLRVAAEKLGSSDWWSGDTLREFLVANDGASIAPMQFVLDRAVEPLAPTWAATVVILEVGIALGLLFGYRSKRWLGLAMVCNFAFLMAGAVNPSVFYIVIQAVLLSAPNRQPFSLRADQPLVKSDDQRGSMLGGLAFLAAGLAVGLLPFVRTIDPARITNDPALVTAFLLALGAVSLHLSRRRLVHRSIDEFLASFSNTRPRVRSGS